MWQLLPELSIAGAVLRPVGAGTRPLLPRCKTLRDEILGARPQWIEHQVAHAAKDPNGRAYNRTSWAFGYDATMD